MALLALGFLVGIRINVDAWSNRVTIILIVGSLGNIQYVTRRAELLRKGSLWAVAIGANFFFLESDGSTVGN